MTRSFEKNSEVKQDVRQFIIDNAPDNPELILTLPGPKKLDAILFHKKFPKTPIIGLENDKNSFKKLLKNPYPVTPYLMSISQYALSLHPTLHHSMIFLDYLGWFDEEKLNDITRLAFNQNLVHDKPTVLGLTFMKANRKGSEGAIESVKGVWKDKETEYSLDCIEAKLSTELSSVKRSLELIECREYTNPGGVGMYFILYRM